VNGPSVTGRSAATFGISAIVTAALTLGVAWVVVPPRQSPPTSPGPGDADGAQAGFKTVPNPSQPATPLGPPPDDQVIQLVSFNRDAPPPSFGERAPWWTPAGIPRVPHITQFDGGKYASANGVMAAGAMLARLAYGIPTTGSQLRSFPSTNGSSGLTLANLEEAIQEGWGVGFRRGTISRLQFRALLHAGAGAVIIVNYDQLPVGLREQPGFLAAHAMYVDAYRGPGADGHAAEYYVMDPMGRPWKGYDGAWWPAEALERAAMAFSGGGIVTSWAFAGGVEPHGPYPSLPPADYPPSDPKNPPEPIAPLEEPPSALPSGDPTDTQPVGDPGPPTPSDADDYTGRQPLQGVGYIDVFLGLCVTTSPPAFCPPGVPAVHPSPKVQPPTLPPLVNLVPLDLLYADTPQPGLQRTIFSAPAGINPSCSYWPSDGSGQALAADVEAATLDGKLVWIATFAVRPGTYDFVATANQAGVVSTSEVGRIQIGQ
jgi:hypothetical protein